jgi:hypothetical protein
MAVLARVPLKNLFYAGDREIPRKLNIPGGNRLVAILGLGAGTVALPLNLGYFCGDRLVFAINPTNNKNLPISSPVMTFFQLDQKLRDTCDRLIDIACSQYPLTPKQIAIALLVYDAESIIDCAAEDESNFWHRRIRGYSHRGIELVYPASVIKLFYMVALHEWLDKGMLTLTSETERALRDMIVDSSNDATALIVDVLSGTTGGPELSPGPFATWQYQRQIVNRYFSNLGVPEYGLINVCQKTWCDGPYGRERDFYGENMENRNMLTTEATARLLHSIFGGVAISRDRSAQMRSLLYRSIKPQDLASDPYNQVTGFLGGGLPENARLWSKAGLTSKVRHDAAYVEMPGCPAFMLVVFTEGDPHNQEILPFFSSNVVAELTGIAPRQGKV